MAFEKLIKTTYAGLSSGAFASFTVSRKRGIGSLRITQRGMKSLTKKRIKLLIGDMIDIFFDEETKIIAIVRSQNGEFKLGKNTSKNETIRISSADLTKKIKVNTQYDLDVSDKYDLILIPQK